MQAEDFADPKSAWSKFTQVFTGLGPQVQASFRRLFLRY
jgi:hypothetical protein